MAFPGSLSARTLVLYRLDPSGTVPIEPLLDFKVGLSADRITADLIESEQFGQTYQVTQNTLSNSALITSHVTKALKTLSVNVFFVPAPVQGATAVLNPLALLAPLTRLDLARVKNIQTLADRGIPIGVYTPRWGLPRAFVTSISAPWDPEIGKNTRLSLNFLEARIVGPATGTFTDDYTKQLPGNNKVDGGGQSSSTAGNPTSLADPTTFGQAPSNALIPV